MRQRFQRAQRKHVFAVEKQWALPYSRHDLNKAVMRAWPEIELDLDFSDRLMTRTLGMFRYKLVGSPAHFAEQGIPETPAELF